MSKRAALTPTLIERLERKYSAPEWAFFPEVGNAAGFAANRRADALALNLWPSRGLEMIGFEIKMERADWLRELKNPRKAEAFAQYTDRWFVVVPNDDVVALEEVPEPWGVLKPHAGGLRIIKKAALTDTGEWDRLFVTALIRRIWIVDGGERHKLERDAFARGVRDAKKTEQQELARAHLRLEEYKEAARAFNRASGLKISNWNAGDVGAAVKIVMNGGVKQAKRTLATTRESLVRALAVIEQELGKQ